MKHDFGPMLGFSISYFLTFLNKNYIKIMKSTTNNQLSLWVIENESDNLLYHIKYSTLNYFSKLIDITAYMINIVHGLNDVYNVLLRQFFFFKTLFKVSIFSINKKVFKSCESVFLNANWMERECSEMLSLVFKNKYDTRNLLLAYFDLFKPLLKQNSSVGNLEVVFNLYLMYCQKVPTGGC